DKEAISIIIDRYYTDIFRFCLYMVQSEEDAYDITQETFLKFIRYGTSYQHNNLKGYLLTIARNICFTFFRDKKGKLTKCKWEEIDDIPCGIDNIKEAEASIYLGSMLRELPQDMREVIILRIYEEMKFKDIARIMGCSISTAKSRFRLGVKHLKSLMEDDYEG
ncbi:MAG: RNA polymerase sigma factor, partial [Bacillota bacterium]|nr:RNA polymerase sigma factor [Bacillota bacterium]